MKKWIYTVLVACGLFVTLRPALSEELVFLSPTRVNLSDVKKVESLTVTNLSDVPRTYRVGLVNIVMTEAGVTTEVENFEHSAKRFLRFVPREFSVAPGGRQTVRVMSRLPSDLPEGDYRVHLEVTEDITKRPQPVFNKDDPNAGSMIVAPVEHSALIPVIISHGKPSAKVAIKDPKIVKAEKEGVPHFYKLTLTITREGNGQGTAILGYFYVSPSGQVMPIGKRSTAQIYREISKRQFTRELYLTQAPEPGAKILVGMFPDNSPNAKALQELTIALP